jgi:uncharacterized protein (TIGR02646 family)
MRTISKEAEPNFFTTWKQAHPHAKYEDLSRKVKRDLKESLIKEQKGLCCYCESLIDKDHSHIEHFKPKGVAEFSHLELDYNNLHASCTKNAIAGMDVHCGHKKDCYYSETLLSPLEPNCHTHFSYTMDGKIHAADPQGTEAINVYNLNSELLIKKRKSLIESLTEEDITEEDIIDHIDDTKDKLGEFITMITYLYNNKNI